MAKGSNKQNPSAKRAHDSAPGIVDNADTGRYASARLHADTDASMVDDNTLQSEPEQPQTCCPACQTVFEVPAELLASNDTRVRCGECLSIFDALISLRRESFLDDDDGFLVDEDGNIFEPDSPYADAMAGADGDIDNTLDFAATTSAAEQASASSDERINETADLDVTYSDFDLFSGEVELPEVAYFDQTQDTQHLRFEDPDGDQTFSDTLFSHDLTVEPVDLSPPGARSPAESGALDMSSNADFVTDETGQAPLDFHYRDREASQIDMAPPAFSTGRSAPLRDHDELVSRPLSTSRRASGSTWIMRCVLALLLIILAVGLYSYRNRDAMLQNPVLRPWAERICDVVGCQLRPMVALDKLKVLKRTVFSHPTIEGSLVIDLAFVNQASFKQPYPVLEIKLTDRNGGLVIQNDVTPADYLDQWREADRLKPGERLDLSLILEDPGQLATSFELKFR